MKGESYQTILIGFLADIDKLREDVFFPREHTVSSKERGKLHANMLSSLFNAEVLSIFVTVTANFNINFLNQPEERKWERFSKNNSTTDQRRSGTLMQRRNQRLMAARQTDAALGLRSGLGKDFKYCD